MKKLGHLNSPNAHFLCKLLKLYQLIKMQLICKYLKSIFILLLLYKYYPDLGILCLKQKRCIFLCSSKNIGRWPACPANKTGLRSRSTHPYITRKISQTGNIFNKESLLFLILSVHVTTKLHNLYISSILIQSKFFSLSLLQIMCSIMR